MEMEAAEALRIGIIVMHKLHPVFEQRPHHAGPFPVIQLLVPAQIVEICVLLKKILILPVLIFQDIAQDRFKLLEIDLRDAFPEFRELIHPVEPALAAVPQPQCPCGGPVIVSAVHIAQAQIKIPYRAAVKQGIPRFFVKIKAVELVVRLDKKVLDEIHAGPGIEIKIVPYCFPCLRIDAVLLINDVIVRLPFFIGHSTRKKRFFGLPDIVGNILIFPGRGNLGGLEYHVPRLGCEPVVLRIVAVVKFDQIAARDILRFILESAGHCLVSVFVRVHHKGRRRIRTLVGIFVGLVQIRDVHCAALYVDPLRQQADSVTAPVEIDIDKACLRCIGQSQPLRRGEGIVLPGLGRIPVIRNQSILAATVHAKDLVLVFQIQVVGLLGLCPGAVAASPDGTLSAGILSAVRPVDPVGRILGSRMPAVRIDSLHGAALGIDIHGGHIFRV